MADVATENPANTIPPHKKQLPSSIPNFDSLEGFSTDGNDDYSTFKKLQRQLECAHLYPPPGTGNANLLPGTFIYKKSTSKMSSGA